MYVNRIQLANYGPIDRLDIMFPFDRERPKPVAFVGPNGSGKSILLSHIVNGLLLAKQRAFPQSPEIKTDMVYKLRSPQYIALGKDSYFARVDYTNSFWIGELQLNNQKKTFGELPEEANAVNVEKLWNNMKDADTSYIDTRSFRDPNRSKTIFLNNCILYFPPDRYEDPAWLNETNLLSKASHLNLSHLEGHTERKIINYSPLRENQDWLFDVVYDSRVFELQTSQIVINSRAHDGSVQPKQLSVVEGYSGRANTLLSLVLQVVRVLLDQHGNLSLSIGYRHNRVLSVLLNNQMLVPNIFQLSSGEVSLLNLFLSILRDYDLTDITLQRAEDIKGIVVVDEIDLHLHTRHQHDILPRLISMFPNVQFIVTTHSPLFVLGLQKILGDDGFSLYSLPNGHLLGAEEFGEFGEAFRVFANTQLHLDEVRLAVRQAQKPLIFVDGATDVRYHTRAAQVLGFSELLESAEFRDGSGMLKKIWSGLTKDHVERQKVIVLYDPESNVGADQRENVFRRKIEKMEEEDNPIQRGVENLFSRETLQRAVESRSAFIDKIEGHGRTLRGSMVKVPEVWAVNKDEKSNLCDWICENGTVEDFRHFQPVLEMIHEIVENKPKDLVE